MLTTSSVAPIRTTSTNSPDHTKKAGLTEGDFTTFLTMLATQIKNQDPLNPMDGADFAVQLATFSGVEQQVQTNMLLQKIIDSQVHEPANPE